MEVQKLSPDGRLPEDLKARMREMEWTPFMQEVFDLLNEKNVSLRNIMQ